LISWLKDLFGLDNKKDFRPLPFYPGDVVHIDKLDYRDDTLIVSCILFCSRCEDERLSFTDYDLTTAGKEDTLTKLRCFKEAEGFSILLLERIESFGYAQEFQDIVNDPSGIFHIGEESFFRPNGVRGSASFKIGEVVSVAYWDFWRDNEVVVAQMDNETGWFEIYRGYCLERDEIS
jgi:hypothetical protein